MVTFEELKNIAQDIANYSNGKTANLIFEECAAVKGLVDYYLRPASPP